MSLPKNVLYTNSIESSHARNYNNHIAPQNGVNGYGGGETVIINIPSGRNLVMSGADSLLKFSVVVKNDGTATDYIRLDKAGAHSFIQRVRVFHGSTLLSDIDNYNTLVAMMMALQTSGDSFRGKHSILSGLEELGVTYTKTTTDTYCSTMNLISGQKLTSAQVAGNGTTASKTFTVPIMNFLSYSDKYIPLFAMTGAPLRIEIQLVSNPQLGLCSHTSLDSLTVNDVEYICNFMEISDSGMSIIQNALQGQPLKWVVQDYRNYGHSATVNSGVQLSVPLPAKFNSLRSLFVAFRENYAGIDTFFPLESTHFELSEYNFRLGSKTVPTKAPSSVPEFFGELVRAIGCVSDLNHEPSINLDSYDVALPPTSDENGTVGNNETATQPNSYSKPSSFYVGLDLESYSNSGMNDVYQGYNSSTDDIFFNPKFGTLAAAHNIRIDTFAYFDQVIVIENGFCSVQY